MIGGDLGAAGAPLLDGIREAIERTRCRGPPTRRRAAGVLGERAEVLGALGLVIGNTERVRSEGLPALELASAPGQ